MREALELAKEAASKGEVPVGAVLVRDDQVIARGYNLREAKQDPLSHAEMEAIGAACKSLKTWRLSDCELYVTLEPCIMCAGAIHQARLSRVVYGALDPKAGAMGSLYNVHEDMRLNHRLPVKGGVLADESVTLLRDFFKQRR
jgi:tRNA(adenine34) deaminase